MTRVAFLTAAITLTLILAAAVLVVLGWTPTVGVGSTDFLKGTP